MEENKGTAPSLVQMEQAAQVSSDPEDIKECRAGQRVPASHEDKVWLVTLLVLVVLFAGGYLLVHWQTHWFSENVAARLSNYLRGAALVTGILLLARLIEVRSEERRVGKECR